MRITYKKKNGDIIQKIVGGYSTYRIGAVNSFGWTVENIEHLYKGKYYTEKEFRKRLSKDFNNQRKLVQIKSRLYKFYRELAYFLLLMILFKIFEVASKVLSN